MRGLVEELDCSIAESVGGSAAVVASDVLGEVIRGSGSDDLHDMFRSIPVELRSLTPDPVGDLFVFDSAILESSECHFQFRAYEQSKHRVEAFLME